MIIAVTAFRDYRDAGFIRSTLGSWLLWCQERCEHMHVRVGDAPGGDAITYDWCRQHSLSYDIGYKVFRADWDRYGRGKGSPAGPIRNKQMLTGEGDPVAGYADLLLGFPRTDGARITVPGSGTWGCVIMAAELGIKVEIPPYVKGQQ